MHGSKTALVLDGAMGTELLAQGLDLSPPLWSARPLLSAPGRVTDLHARYIASGADVITTDTFRTNPRAFRDAGLDELRAREATRLAVDCARRAIGLTGATRVQIAGSMAPVSDCYHPERVPSPSELEIEHGLLASWLAEAGVKLALVETMNTAIEAAIAVRQASKAGMMVWASFVCGKDPDRLLGGELLREAARWVVQEGAVAVGVNCVPPEQVAASIEVIRSVSDVDVLVYANGGRAEPGQPWKVDESLTPSVYGRHVERWLLAGARIIGACCGTGPGHVEAIRNTVDKWCRRA